jgi:hypothetical protein
LEEAISTWPEYATSVGVRLNHQEEIEIFAPYGLEDLLSMTVRRNPKRVSQEVYQTRCREKNYPERWPLVKVIIQ